ncbi:DUF4236 domain-containing protein [Bradyrhizobium sp. USDA 4454]
MSFRFTRRMSILPGVRLNFSGSGISTTIGVPGVGLTLGGRGGPTVNLGIPGTGISYRQPLTSGPRTGNSIEAPDLSAPSEQLIHPAPAERPDMRAIQSDAVGSITTPGLLAFRELVLTAQHQRDASERDLNEAISSLENAERAAIEARDRHDRAELRVASLEASWFRALRGGAIAVAEKEIEQAARDIVESNKRVQDAGQRKDQSEQKRDTLWLNTEFSLPGAAHAAWTRASEAFVGLSKSERKWDITAYRAKGRGQERSVATEIVERSPIELGTSELPIIHSEYVAMRLQNANGADLFVYPGFVAVYQTDRNFALVDLQDVELTFVPVRFHETERIPSDTKQIGSTWQYTNKDGSPDRRYADNAEIPVVLYAQLNLKSATGLSEAYMFSNAQAAASFADAIADFRRALAASTSPATPVEIQPNLSPALESISERVAIQIKEAIQQPGTTAWRFNCDFRCKKCGGGVISLPDNHTDQSIASCKACGAEFGVFADIKEIAKLLGDAYLRSRGLTIKDGEEPTYFEGKPDLNVR